MNQWAWTEKERSLLIMVPSILSQRLQQLGLEHERIADCDCLALANAGQNLEQPIVAVAERDRTLFESARDTNEDDPRLADGLDGAGRHGERSRAFLDRDRTLDQ